MLVNTSSKIEKLKKLKTILCLSKIEKIFNKGGLACIGLTGICRAAVVAGLGLSCASGNSQVQIKKGIDAIAALGVFRRSPKGLSEARLPVNVYIIEYAANIRTTNLTANFFNENFVKKSRLLTVGTRINQR